MSGAQLVSKRLCQALLYPIYSGKDKFKYALSVSKDKTRACALKLSAGSGFMKVLAAKYLFWSVLQ